MPSMGYPVWRLKALAVQRSASGRRWREAMPAHDFRDLRSIRRTSETRPQHLVDLTEVVRAHDAWAGHCQELGVFSPVVVESVHGTARYAQGLAWAHVERPTVHPPSRDALEPVDRLLEGIVTVRHGHRAVCGNEALEDAHASVRVGGLNQEAHAERAHLNHIGRSSAHAASGRLVVPRLADSFAVNGFRITG